MSRFSQPHLAELRQDVFEYAGDPPVGVFLFGLRSHAAEHAQRMVVRFLSRHYLVCHVAIDCVAADKLWGRKIGVKRGNECGHACWRRWKVSPAIIRSVSARSRDCWAMSAAGRGHEALREFITDTTGHQAPGFYGRAMHVQGNDVVTHIEGDDGSRTATRSCSLAIPTAGRRSACSPPATINGR